MHPILKGSVILAGGVGVFSALFYALGLHENFTLGQSLFLGGAIAINVAVVIAILSKTAPESTYLQQVGTAAGIGLVGGALIVLASWLLLAVVFPNALDELRAGAVAYMQASDMPQTEVDAQMQMLDATTPMSQSVPGGVGTFFTSLACGLVYGYFARRR